MNLKQAEIAAVKAARAAGELMRRHLRSVKKIHSSTQHDIKLELDVRCQKRIERTLRSAYTSIAILGEEGVVGDTEAEYRWVVDPIDGTVNFTYGIPHACVSIALQTRSAESGARDSQKGRAAPPGTGEAYRTLIGVVYDPFCDELWTAIRGGRARLNGEMIRVSDRSRLKETIITVGFAKHKTTLNQMIPVVNRMVHRVRKIRIMGSAALAMTYVASGRMDAYLETGIRLWDIAAGGLILECAGGDFWHEPLSGQHRYRVIANNGRLRRVLRSLI
ncbi:MAG TPA: inositol monophosphatase family protein [Verrucomicrobiae bacterium]|nr:inositol monophosphatase family protein [Verrucomicrobiae bacterium]